MKLTYIKSACVIVEHEGVKVLCDPWLTEGIYYGSWFHYPPLKFKPEDFSDVDFIYLSHIHPDHADPETLKRLPKHIPVYILEYKEKYLLKMVSSLGFNVIEIPHKKKAKLGPEFQLELLAADNCQPEVCGKLFGCSKEALRAYMDGKALQIDSMGVFKGGSDVIVNTNDCIYELAYPLCDYINQNYEKVDLALIGYSGAGSYPQCYQNLSSDEKQREGMKKREKCIERGVNYVKHLKAKAYLPFAGQYTLGGRLAALNDERYVPELEDLPGEFEGRIGGSRLVLLNSGDFYDTATGEVSANYIPADPAFRKLYIENVLKNKKYSYDKESENIDLEPLLENAQQKMRERQKIFGGFKSDWSIYFDLGEKGLFELPFDGRKISRVESVKEPYLRIQLHYNLFLELLHKKAHWNTAEIGSHLMFFRKPNVYRNDILYALYYFTL